MSDQEGPRDWWRQERDELARDPGQWRLSARFLLRGAFVLRMTYESARDRYMSAHDGRGAILAEVGDDLLLGRTALLLAGMGLETLMKGVLVASTPSILDTDAKSFYTHRLASLFDEASILVDSDERKTLKKLQELVEWVGRYPVPKWSTERGRRKYDVRTWADDGKVFVDADSIPGSLGDDSWPIVVSLIEKASTAYGEATDQMSRA